MMFTSIKLILFLAHLASSSILKVDAFITPLPRNVVIVRNYRPLHTFTNDRIKHIDIPSSIKNGIGGGSIEDDNDDDNNYYGHGGVGHNNNNGGGSGGGGGSGDDGETGGFYNDPRFVLSTLSIAFAERYKRDIELQQKTISTLFLSSVGNKNGLSSLASSSLSLSASTTATTTATVGTLPTIHKQIMKRVISFVQSNAQPQLVSAKVKATEYIKWYIMEIEKNPLIVKSVSSGIISLCADFAAQSFEQRQALQHDQQQEQQNSNHHQTSLKGYDKRRLWACFTEGMFIAGPLMHFGYSWFESILPIHNGISSSQGSNIAAATQVIADSIILDSIFVATKILSTGILEGLSFHNDIIPQFQNEYWDTMKASWVTSIGLFPVEFACFRYLPLSLRTFSMSITSIIWDSVVSHKAHESRLL